MNLNYGINGIQYQPKGADGVIEMNYSYPQSYSQPASNTPLTKEEIDNQTKINLLNEKINKFNVKINNLSDDKQKEINESVSKISKKYQALTNKVVYQNKEYKQILEEINTLKANNAELRKKANDKVNRDIKKKAFMEKYLLETMDKFAHLDAKEILKRAVEAFDIIHPE